MKYIITILINFTFITNCFAENSEKVFSNSAIIEFASEIINNGSSPLSPRNKIIFSRENSSEFSETLDELQRLQILKDYLTLELSSEPSPEELMKTYFELKAIDRI